MSYNKFGIGIAAPADNLHVLGAVRFGDSSSSTNQARIYAGSTWSAWQTRTGTDAFIIDQTTARVGFPSSVGIGTTSPMNTATFQVRYGTNENFTIREIEGTHPQLSAVQDGFADYIPLSIDGTPLRLNNFGGNVGIGTTNPISKLHMAKSFITPSGTWSPTDCLAIGDRIGTNIGLMSLGWRTDGGPASYGWIQTSFNNSDVSQLVLQPSAGNVGIGTTAPGYPLHINSNGPTIGSFTGGYLTDSGAGSGTITSGTYASVSLFTTRSIWTAWTVLASSDRRIKKEISEINDGEALEKLRALKPSTYKYIDSQKSTSTVYGFIAQEVREILPHAVTIQKSIIPNIMKIAIVNQDNVVTLADNYSHGLINGDLVRIITESNGEKEYIVSDVISESSFLVEGLLNADDPSRKVFVYGKEVDDFHTLDKNTIFTVGVAATQELDRKVVSLENELRELKELLRSKNIM